MQDAIHILKGFLERYQGELEEINKKIEPLEKKRIELFSKIQKYQEILNLESGIEETTPNEVNRKRAKIILRNQNNNDKTTSTLDLAGLSPIEAYRDIITTLFKDGSFREVDIRKSANKAGVTTRDGAHISSSYSRSIFVHLRKTGFVKQIDRGEYRYQRQQSIMQNI